MKKSTRIVKSTRKFPAKKTVAKKRAAVKGFSASTRAPSLAVARKIPKTPSGYVAAPGGTVLIPVARKKPGPSVVGAGKLQAGLASAQEQISGVLQQLVDAASHGYEIAEIELAASFNADGKFLGFGVGGAATIKFKVRPCRDA